jgi:pimeloyl-ACP methyl ester carboxylesterase
VQRETFSFDGLRVPVEIRGSASETLVFLPGLGAHPRYYRPGLERLACDFRVVMPDLSFRTHRSLPRDVSAYMALVEALAGEFAPDAPWCGHSFGGFLALLSPRPAIACAPSVPIRVPFVVIVGRAIRLQLKEYTGGEGRSAIKYAWRIMLDYVRAAVVTPRAIYPVVGDTTRGFDESFRPAAECAVVYLSRTDCLYRPGEYEEYLDRVRTGTVRVEHLKAGHDWPVTHPDLVPRLVGEAYAELRGQLCSGEENPTEG